MKDLRNDFQASGHMHTSHWLSQQELAKLSRRRTPPVRGFERHLVGAIWIVSLTLALWAVIALGPKVPKALNWISNHLGEAVVNATTTGSPTP